MALNKLFWGFRHHAKNLRVKNQLAELQRRAQKNPDNLNLQIRMADLFIKLGKKDEALEGYRQAAEKYAQKSFVSQAIALNKIILRLDPSQIAVNQVPPGLYSHRMDEEGETDVFVK
jgi:thioredoxin-like negative regulator of GroEL